MRHRVTGGLVGLESKKGPDLTWANGLKEGSKQEAIAIGQGRAGGPGSRQEGGADRPSGWGGGGRHTGDCQDRHHLMETLARACPAPHPRGRRHRAASHHVPRCQTSLPSASSTWTGMCSPSTLKVPSTGSLCWRKPGLSPQSAALVSGEARSWGRGGSWPPPERGRPALRPGRAALCVFLPAGDRRKPAPGPPARPLPAHPRVSSPGGRLGSVSA